MSSELVEQWNLRCGHCGKTFTQTKDQIKVGHLEATIKLIKGEEVNREEVLQNYMIPCPLCAKLVSFEPMSQFRQRKIVALEERMNHLKALERTGNQAQQNVVILAEAVAMALMELTRTLVLVEEIRPVSYDLFRTMQEGVEKLGDPGLKNHQAIGIVREMLEIAIADIGAELNLPEAPKDKVSAAQDDLLRALNNLRQESSDKPRTERMAPSPTEAHRCFLATAACGAGQAEDVIRLCEFREKVLRPRHAGRILIQVYECVSPPLAWWIARCTAVRYLVRQLVVRPARCISDRWFRHFQVKDD